MATIRRIGRSNARNTPGKHTRTKMPMTTMAKVYIAKFASSAAVDAMPEIPSRIIKNAQAGWPPVAEGVMAEK